MRETERESTGREAPLPATPRPPQHAPQRPPLHGVGFCLSPFHLMQVLALAPRDRAMTVLSPRALTYAPLLAHVPDLSLRPIEDRQQLWRELETAGQAFDFYYATPWNRTALRFGRLAQRLGGTVALIDDGVANYRPDRAARDAHYFLMKLACRIIDGTRYCRDIHEVDPGAGRTLIYSVDARRSVLRGFARQIDFTGLAGILGEPVERHFAHLQEYRGLPMLFDTNDVETGWCSMAQKIEILQRVVAPVPTLYLPHPVQRHLMSDHLPHLISLAGRTRDWNELAAYYLRPARVYSTFSSVLLTLSKVFRLHFENVLLCDAYHEVTGHPVFAIEPGFRDLLLSGPPSPDPVRGT